MSNADEKIIFDIPNISFNVSRRKISISRSFLRISAKTIALIFILSVVIYIAFWRLNSDYKELFSDISGIFPDKFGIFGISLAVISSFTFTMFMRAALKFRIKLIIEKNQSGKYQVIIVLLSLFSVALTIQINPSILMYVERSTEREPASSVPSGSQPLSPAQPIDNSITKPEDSTPKENNNDKSNLITRTSDALSGCTTSNNRIFRCEDDGEIRTLEVTPIMENGIKIGESIIFSIGNEYYWRYGKTEILKSSINIPEISNYINSPRNKKIINNARFIYSVGTASKDGGDYDQRKLSNDRALTLRSLITTNLSASANGRNCIVPMGRYLDAENDREGQRPLIIVAAYPLEQTGPAKSPEWIKTDAEKVFWGSIESVTTGREALGVSLSGYYLYKNRSMRITCD